MLGRFALFSLLLSVSAGRAESIFLVKEGQWTIGGGKTRCEAMNRPPSEANYAPVNVLFVSMDDKREPVMRIVFWPGALPEKVSALKFTIREGGETHVFDVAAESGSREWNVVSTAGPLPKDFTRLVSDFSKQLFNMDVEVPGSAARTVFDLEGMNKVLSHLHDCVQNLEKAGKG
jgi:hypothetical protein